MSNYTVRERWRIWKKEARRSRREFRRLIEDIRLGRTDPELQALAKQAIERIKAAPKPTEEEIIKAGVDFIMDTSLGGP